MSNPKKNNKFPNSTRYYLLYRLTEDPLMLAKYKNSRYRELADENQVTNLGSLLNEIEYRFKGNPYLGGDPNELGWYKDLNDISREPINKAILRTILDITDFFYNPKLSGLLKKLLGGQLNMNEQQLQQAFLQFLAQKTGAKTLQELEAAIQQMGELGLQQAYQEFMQLMQLQQVQAAKFGAKLNYIKMLRGQCPEGYEMQYYKTGGRLCKKCVLKAMSLGGSISDDPIDLFKCGRKMKKKKAQGGAIDFDKCGKKMKKKENGGIFDSSNFSKATLAKCGAKLKKAACGSKMQKDLKGNKFSKPTKQLDRAGKDSIEVNKYGNLDIETRMPGSYKKNKLGKVQWTLDRSKSPYNKKK